MFSQRLLLIMAIVTIAHLNGCGSGNVSASRSNSSVPGNQQEAVANAADVLSSAIFQLRPENFGINSNTDKPVSLLNSWRFKQAEKDGTVEKIIAPEAPKDWYPPEKEGILSQSKFDLADAVHIRDALFFRAVSGYLSDRGRDELQRTNVVIDFVCRNISLWRGDENEIALRPFSALFFGRGSVEDRAWVSAEILRQLRIDSVIVRAKSDEKQATDQWLFGVVIDGGIHLYDLRLAVPVASGADSQVGVPAKLADIASHPEWLESMSAKGPYNIAADDLKEPSLYVISEPLYWCHRMERLEQVLPATDNCLIYESVSSAEGKSGLLDRIAKSSGRSVDTLKQWAYSNTHDARQAQQGDRGAHQLQLLGLTFIVPIAFRTNHDGKMIPGAPERKMERYRMMHLLGDYADATQRYLSIRRLDVEPAPAEVERLYKVASEDAFYWTALCKLEMDDQSGAIDLLSSYLKKYDRNGKWFFSSRTLLAQAYAAAGQSSKAIGLLERSSSEDPNQQANSLRLKRWSAGESKPESK